MIRRLLMIGVSLLCACAFGRVWTAKDGRKTEAELVSYDSGTGSVVLLRKDGRKFTVPQDGLSDMDILYLKELEAKREEEDRKAGTVVEYTTDGDHSLRYHCYYPEGYGYRKEFPLLILFSPGGSGKGILTNFKAVGDRHDLMVIGCDGFRNNLDADLGREWFDELLPHIDKTVPHKPSELYMGGFSGGALRAYKYSAYYDRPWKGIVACGGWLGGSKRSGLDYRKKMAVAIVNGNNDKNANNWIEHDKSQLKDRRCKVEVFHFDGGHVVGPSEVLVEAMQWIIENRDD